MKQRQFEHLSVVKTNVWTYPTGNYNSPALLSINNIISGSRKDIPLSFTARTHTQTLMLTRMMSRENSFFKHLLQDWILILDDIQKKSNLKGG